MMLGYNIIIIQVINFYMSLLMEGFDDVFAFSTFFYTKLLSDGYEAVTHWYKRDNVFAKRLLLFPKRLLLLLKRLYSDIYIYIYIC